MKKLLSALFAAWAISAIADPIEYWYIGNQEPLHDNRYLWVSDGGETVHEWADGNIMVLAYCGDGYWPAELQGKYNPSNQGQAALYGGETIRPWKLIHKTSRAIYGGGRVELGAGGYEQISSWGNCSFSISGGLSLTADQTWILHAGLSINNDTPITVPADFQWTVTTTANSYINTQGLIIVGSNTLSGATMTLDSRARLCFSTAASALCLDTLKLNSVQTYLLATDDSTLAVDRRYAKEIHLANGASPMLAKVNDSGTSTYGYLEMAPSTEFDVDRIVVESGESRLGTLHWGTTLIGRAPYSVKDGGTLAVEVRAGATVCFDSYPTSGRIKIYGAGKVKDACGGTPDVDYDPNFTGEVVLPKNFYYAGNGNLLGDDYYLWESDEGAEKHAWEDGNTLCIKNSGESYWPAVLQGKHAGGTDTVNVNGAMSLYGLDFSSGCRSMNSTGHIDLGAGGYTGLRAWDYHILNIWGGIRLTQSQTWTLVSGVKFIATCELTAEEGITWTISSNGNSYHEPGGTDLSESRGIGVYVHGSYELDNVDVVLNNAGRIFFTEADSSLCAKTLTIDGTYAALAHSARDSQAPIEIGRLYAPELILRNGASPALFQITYGSSKMTAMTDLVYDLDKLTVSSGESALGRGFYKGVDCGDYTYSIKDAGTLDIDIKAGATLKLYSYPTSGRLRITGAGTLIDMTGGMPDVDYSNFTGTIALSGFIDTIDSMAAFAGSASVTFIDSFVNVRSVSDYTGQIGMTGKSRLALPRTADWPATMTVTTADDATLYLPLGETVDTSKILGTANYLDIAIGQSPVSGTFETEYRHNYAICGDGFGKGSKLALYSGRVDVPVPSKVEADVEIFQLDTAKGPTIRVLSDLECEFSGRWSVNGRFSISNTLYCAAKNQKPGRLVFTGPGESIGGVWNVRSDVEFRGAQAQWTIASASYIEVNDDEGTCGERPAHFDVTGGASLDFLDSTGGCSHALTVGSTVLAKPVVKISTNSVVRFGNRRNLCVGNSAWRQQSVMWITGGRLLLDGNYGGTYDRGAHTTIRGTSDDRTPMVTFRITDGGVLETDRLISVGPISHGLDTTGFTSGLFVEIDGGTYKLGPNFGYDSSLAYPHKSANHLFGGTVGDDADMTRELDYEPEVQITIGANGGTFDLSAANPRNSSFTNAVLGKKVATRNQTEIDKWGDYIPTLGPRWVLNGEITVKGNGSQEFVINGLDAAELTRITADGAAIKVVSDSEAMEFDTLSLGAHGGSFAIEGENPGITVQTLNVLENGAFDPSLFNADCISFNDAVFGSGSAIYVRKVDDVFRTAYFNGQVELATSMKYFADAGFVYGGSAMSAGTAFLTEGTSWSQVSGASARYTVEVSGSNIFLNEPPALPFFMLVR